MSSLESAVSILSCFSAETPELAVMEVAVRLGMPKSTVSRLLQTMAGQGLVEQDEMTRRYRVGLLPFRLGQLYHAHVRVVDLVEAELETLVQSTGFTGYIGVLNGADIVILRRRNGRYPVQMMLDPGYRMAAAATAFGKALLARLTDAHLVQVLPAELVEGRGSARQPVAGLRRELDAARRQHWAVGDTAFPGLVAIGTAVGSADEQQAIGFSLSFPAAAVDARARSEIADRLVAAAQRIAVTTADADWAGEPEAADAAAPRAGKPQRRRGSPDIARDQPWRTL